MRILRLITDTAGLSKSFLIRVSTTGVLAILVLAFTSWRSNHASAQTQTPIRRSTTDTPTQKPVSSENTEAQSTFGTIKGIVVSEEGNAIANVRVSIWAVTGSGSVNSIRSDAKGKFSFSGLPPVLYEIYAESPGYVDQWSLAVDSDSRPRYLIGSQVKITMIKGGAITGTVTDSRGDPIVGVPVRATVTGHWSSLKAQLYAPSWVETDDRGIYRIFGLPPADYFVAAGGQSQHGRFVSTGYELDAPTYYPSSNRDTAVPISVKAGEDATGIDIKYRGTRGHSISGFVLGTLPTIKQPYVVEIMLAPAGAYYSMANLIAPRGEPRRPFTFQGLADGEYDLVAEYSYGQTSPNWLSSKRIAVSGADVTGIELTLNMLSSISGSIALDPIKPDEKCDKRGSSLLETLIEMNKDDQKVNVEEGLMSSLADVYATLNTTGEFIIHRLQAGKYRFAIRLPTDSWYIRSINLPAPGPQPPTASTATNPKPGAGWSGTVTLKSGEQSNGISILIGQNAAGLSGQVVVTPESRVIPAGLHMHLIPASQSERENVLRYDEVPVNADGKFEFRNIAPGRYYVLARLESSSSGTFLRPRLIAWDTVERTKLRQEAESANKIVELKPCQRMSEYVLKNTSVLNRH